MSCYHKFLVESKEDFFAPREVYATDHREAAEKLTTEFWLDWICFHLNRPEYKDGRLDLKVSCLCFRGPIEEARSYTFVKEGYIFIGNISGRPIFEEVENG